MPLDWILRPDVLGLGMGLVALVVAAIGLWRAGELSHRIKRQAHEIQALQQRLDQRTPPTQAAQGERADEHETPRPVAPAPQPPASGPHHGAATIATELTSPPRPAEVDSAPAPATDRIAPPPLPAQPRATTGTESPPEAARPTGWEERLGARVTVWVGAIALALAGAYLVKYSFDNNLLSPAVRIGLGVAFGLALLIGAQPLHRRTPGVAAAMAAAGVADLFACVLGATRLYELVGPVAGFVMMAALAAAAVGLSLRHGRLVAVVGLSGGFLTPALIGANVPDARLTFGYLLLLQMGLVAVTRRRGWWVMALLTLAGSLIWSGAFLVMIALDWTTDASATWLGLFILATAGSFIFAGWSTGDRSVWARTAIGRALTWVSMVAAVFGLATLIGVDAFATIDWLLLGLLVLGAIALARLRPEYLTLNVLVATASVMMLAVWAIGLPHAQAGRWLMIAGIYAALLVLGPFAAMWRSGREPMWATIGGAAPVALLLIGRLARVPLPEPWAWWMIATALAGGVGGLAAVAGRHRRSVPGSELAPAAWITSTATLLALAAALALERPWVGPAWAGLALVVTGLACGLRLPPLRAVAGLLGAIAVGQTLLDPQVYRSAVGSMAVLNELGAVHGLVMVALLVAVAIHRRSESEAMGLPTVLESLAWGTATAAVAYQVRHGFAPTADGTIAVGAAELTFLESATYVVAWMTLAAGLLMLRRALDWASLRWAGPLISALAGATAVVLVLKVHNPLLTRAEIGDWPIVNGLMYGYAAPAALAGAVAWLTRRMHRGVPIAAGAFCVVMLLVWLTLTVRHLFHGEDMILAPDRIAGMLEWTSYTNLWLIIGIAALAFGRWRRSIVTSRIGLAIALLGALAAVFALGAAANPLWRHESVGGTVLVNWLLAMFAAPALLAALAARLVPERDRPAAVVLGIVGLVMLFVFVSLQVRQYFHGAYLDVGETTAAEWYTYSAAWVALGLALLVAGVISANRAVRCASLAVMGLAVVKVFVSDTAHLENLYRVLSFLGLGVSLLVLGFVYQRFVFGRKGD